MQTKTKTAKSRKTSKVSCGSPKWFKSNRTRPKTVVLTLERTTTGYTIQGATILNPINQYAAVPVSVDARTITQDITTRGGIL